MKAAFFDLDKTLYNGFLFYEWLRFLWAEDVISVSDLAKIDEVLLLHKLGRHSYTETAEYVARTMGEIIKDKSASDVIESTNRFVETISQNFYSYTEPLIYKAKEKGFFVVFVTNEPEFLAEAVKTKLGAGDAIGLDYEIKDGIFTGELKNNLASAFGKAKTIADYCDANKINPQECVAAGDSESDIEMLNLVGKGVLVNADEKTKLLAKGTQTNICNENGEILHLI